MIQLFRSQIRCTRL